MNTMAGCSVVSWICCAKAGCNPQVVGLIPAAHELPPPISDCDGRHIFAVSAVNEFLTRAC